MKPRLAAGALALALGAAASPSLAQISFTNLVETRIGRDPEDAGAAPPELTPSASRASLFDQFSLDWTSGPLRLGFRFETYTASDTLTAHYQEFVRRYASWTSGHLEATVGNYEAMFGRGLVLRAFELPGVVREEYGTPQFGDSRDLFGVLAQAHAERADLVAVYGEPRGANQDPTQARGGTTEGASGWVEPLRSLRLGSSYLRIDTQGTGPGSRPELGGGFVQLGLDPYLARRGVRWLSLDTYVEYDAVHGIAVPPSVSSPRAEPDRGYMLYGSQTVILDEILPGFRWGVSYELKDYQNYELGVNEPPTLVREQQWVLLNRSTHVVDPLQEQGYQLESRMDYRERLHLVLNWSRAENPRSRLFKEAYAELSWHPRRLTFTLFADDAQDENDAVLDRDTAGGYALVPVSGPHSVQVELERQQVDRGITTPIASFEDRFASLRYAWAGRFDLGFVRQTTDDPREATDPVTGEISRRAFDSAGATIDIPGHHQLELFWGRRRSGLACTAGTCYKVRGFDGVSARLVTRF